MRSTSAVAIDEHPAPMTRDVLRRALLLLSAASTLLAVLFSALVATLSG